MDIKEIMDKKVPKCFQYKLSTIQKMEMEKENPLSEFYRMPLSTMARTIIEQWFEPDAKIQERENND